MSYSIQIEPLTTTKMNHIKVIESSKRQSLYTCIRYASKLIKLPSEYRKHRTLPTNDSKMISTSYNNIKMTTTTESNNYCYDITNDDIDEEGEEETLYDEKDIILPNKHYATRHDSQLALPSRLQYVVNHNEDIKVEVQENFDDEDDDEEEEEDNDDEFDNYIMDDSYTSTLQKLSGISFNSNNKKNTAVLITLSPCALAAANAARQKRQKIRISH
jgi:hypothetical protein